MIDVISIAWDHEPDDDREVTVDIGELDPWTAFGLLAAALDAVQQCCTIDLRGSQIAEMDGDD